MEKIGIFQTWRNFEYEVSKDLLSMNELNYTLNTGAVARNMFLFFRFVSGASKLTKPCLAFSGKFPFRISDNFFRWLQQLFFSDVKALLNITAIFLQRKFNNFLLHSIRQSWFSPFLSASRNGGTKQQI